MHPKQLFYQYKWRFALTFLLIVLEGFILILFPLFIGNVIDGVLNGHFSEAFNLGFLGILLLVVGVGRRVLDSRFYADVYREVGVSTMVRLKAEKTSLKTARLHMIEELVEFFENAFPELINNIIGLFGVVGILFSLNHNVFLGSLIVTLLILIIYGISTKRTTLYHQQFNNELERQVDVVSKTDTVKLGMHLKELMRWNIKLSDLEALNFSVSWLVALIFLVISIVVSVSDGIVTYGVLFALVMYAFQYIEHVLNLPLFYQNWLGLKEIFSRLGQDVKS